MRLNPYEHFSHLPNNDLTLHASTYEWASLALFWISIQRLEEFSLNPVWH
jgi:hypothetical protein